MKILPSELLLRVRLPRHILIAFKAYCIKKDITMSQMIRRIIVDLLSAEEKNA